MWQRRLVLGQSLGVGAHRRQGAICDGGGEDAGIFALSYEASDGVVRAARRGPGAVL